MIRHLSFPKAGHVLFPYDPASATQTAPVPFDLGGDQAAADHAHAKAWPEVVRHLRCEEGAIGNGAGA